MLLTLVISLQ